MTARRAAVLVAAAAAGIAALGWLLTAPQPLQAAALPDHRADPANGERVFFAASCASCHAAPEAKGDRTVCHSDAHTGSRVATRTCRTERQWREAEDSSAEGLRTNRPISCTAGLGVCAGGR